jgi:hypothetical protein
VRDVGPHEPESHLDDALEAAGDDRHAARAEPEDQNEGDRRNELDQVDPVDRERVAEQDDVPELDKCRREEFVDRGGVKFAPVFSREGDQCRSLSKQRWLQLRGIGVNLCDDGR